MNDFALESALSAISVFAALAASALSWTGSSRGNKALGVLASCSAGLASLALLASCGFRWAASGHPPFASMYEFGLLMTLAMLASHFALRIAGKDFGGVIFPLAFLSSAVNVLFWHEAAPLMPALKSWWLVAHVLTAVAAYGLLAVSCGLAVAWLVSREPESSPARESLRATADRLVAIAFPFLTLLIATGAVWAQYAWGSWWRWDPKETWALVTWLVYLAYLHGTRTRKWKPRTAMIFAVAGFITVLFTYFGVNLLLAGLHSYA